MLFFTCITLVAHVLACACAIARIKWRRLGEMGNTGYLFVSDVNQGNEEVV